MNKLILTLCVASFINSFCFAQFKGDLIEWMRVDKQSVEIAMHPDLKAKYFTDNFRVSYEKDIDISSMGYSVQTLAFLLNTISVVWISGDSYSLDEMDEQLFESLKIVKEVFKRLYPRTSFKGQVIPKKLVANSFVQPDSWKSAKQIALCFTRGLDSTYSSLKHRDKKQHLINVLREKNSSEYVQQTKEMIQDFAKAMGHKTSFVVSNYQNFLNRDVLGNLSPDIKHWRLDLVEGLGWISFAVPIMIARNLSLGRVAASLAWNCLVNHAPLPHVDNNIKFGNLRFFHDGFDVSRVDKARYIGRYYNSHKDKKPFIRVCFQQFRIANCSNCEKCFRTASEFLVAGVRNYNYFGFNFTDRSLYFLGRRFFKTSTLSRYCLWHYQCIQDELKKYGMYLHNRSVVEKWLMSFNFQSVNRDKDPGLYVTDWDDFIDLMPDYVD